MTGDAVPLGAGAEFDVIRAMHARWGALAVGLGDDAAALDVPRGEQLLVSTDTALEDVHFRRAWLPLADIGYRAVTAALSDLAAMAAQPLGVLVALQMPRLAPDEIDAIADGIGAAVRAADTVVRGGNVSSGERLGITTTVLGSAVRPLRRTAARPGDLVYVTGSFGGPAAAVRMLEGGHTPGGAVRDRFVRPAARIREARWLARRGAVAAIDVSDGLAGDAAHLAAASGVAIDIDVDRVPMVPGAAPEDVFGGEEYELLLVARAGLPAAEFAAAFGSPLTRVGTVAAGSSVSLRRGAERVASPGAYDHFSR